jgi:hypothetical protein
MTESARMVGDTLARIVNFYNPSLILLGGQLLFAGDAYLATIRNIVYSRSLPLATRELVIAKVALGERAALHGAASLALDGLFAPEYFAVWSDGAGAPKPLPTDSRPASEVHEPVALDRWSKQRIDLLQYSAHVGCIQMGIQASLIPPLFDEDQVVGIGDILEAPVIQAAVFRQGRLD